MSELNAMSKSRTTFTNVDVLNVLSLRQLSNTHVRSPRWRQSSDPNFRILVNSELETFLFARVRRVAAGDAAVEILGDK